MADLQVQKFPVDKIKSSPTQARTNFDEASLQDLAASLKERGLKQPILVRLLADGSPELIAGERRLRAAKLLGWTTINAVIQPDTSDQDAAIDGLIENLQREDLNPIEQAKGYMRLADMGKDNAEIGRLVGKNRVVVSRFLDLLTLPPEIQESVTRGTLSETHTRSIRQIPDKQQQIALAQEAADEGWSVKRTEQEVNKLGRKPGKAHSSARSVPPSPAQPTPPDPLADFWDEARSKNEYLGMNYANWGVSYGRHELMKTSGGKSIGVPAYTFWFAAVGPLPKADLKKWFQALLDSMGDTQEEEDRFHKVLEAVVPKDISDLNKMEQQGNGARIPETPEEMAKLEKLAAESASPGPVYNALLGSDSVLARQMSSLTWEAMGIKDRVAGCRQIVEGMREMRDMRARVSQKAPAPPPAMPGDDVQEEEWKRHAELMIKRGRII